MPTASTARNQRRASQKYLRRLSMATAFAQAVGEMPKSGVFISEVRHDAHCPMPDGAGPCVCSPDIGLRDGAGNLFFELLGDKGGEL